MRREQFHAEGMNRSKKRATERFHGFQRQARFEDLLSRSLLHFIGSAICVGNDDELRQPFAAHALNGSRFRRSDR